ncbi:MAG: hypothetical protein IJ131_09620, partial [Eggerthellaceae bacterium]|nr:hypothetical protein [Eggerthellaceae bacterium]
FTTMLMRTTFYSLGPLAKEDFEAVAYALCAVLLVAKLLSGFDKSAGFFVALALVAVGAASVYVAGAWRFSLLFFFIAAGKDISLRVLAALVLVVQLGFLVVTLPLGATGAIDSVYVHRLVDGAWVPRSSYGYSHPNLLGEVLLTIACAFAVLRFPRFGVVDFLVFLAAGLAAALLGWSRTATACIVFAGLLAAAAPFLAANRRRRTLAAGAALAAFCALGALSLFMMVFYDPDVAWMKALDSALSTRFSLAHEFYEVYKPTLFGREIMYVKTEEVLQAAPDNAYVRTLVKQGIVPFVALGALMVATFAFAVRRSIYDACVFGLLVYAVVAVMEMYATNFTLNYFLVGCAWTVFGCWPRAAREGEGSFAQ